MLGHPNYKKNDQPFKIILMIDEHRVFIGIKNSLLWKLDNKQCLVYSQSFIL